MLRFYFSGGFREAARTKIHAKKFLLPLLGGGGLDITKKPPFPDDVSEIRREGDRFEHGVRKLGLGPSLPSKVSN